MEDTQKTATRMLTAEDVLIGDRSSGVSTAIFVLICVLPVLSTILFGGVDNTTWIFISLAWVILVLLWLVESWRGGGILLNPSSLQLPLAGLVVIGLVQMLPIGSTNGVEILGRPIANTLSLEPYATRFFVIRLVVYLFFFAACLTFVNTERRLKRSVMLAVTFGALMAFFGIMQRLANPEGIYGLRGTPQAIPFGSFVNQHHFAAFMQMTAGLAFGLLFGRDIGRDKRLLLATAVIIMGIAAVLTGSRGGLLAFVSVLAFVTIFNFITGRRDPAGDDARSSRRGPILATVVTVGGVFVIFGAVLLIGGNEQLLRGIGLTNADADISSGRLRFWPIALRIFLDHPIVGAGFDAFGVAFTRYDTTGGLFRVEQAHNDYLQVLADGGLVGFACVAAFIYLLFRKGLGTIANSPVGFRKDAAIGALAGCCGIMIHSFFDFPLRTPSNAFFFLFLCAVVTVPVLIGRTPSKRRRRSTT